MLAFIIIMCQTITPVYNNDQIGLKLEILCRKRTLTAGHFQFSISLVKSVFQSPTESTYGRFHLRNHKGTILVYGTGTFYSSTLEPGLK